MAGGLAVIGDVPKMMVYELARYSNRAGALRADSYDWLRLRKQDGMIIADGPVSVCGTGLNVGSYGFGLDKPAPNSNDNAQFNVYNQAAEKVGDCASKKDDNLNQPAPGGHG